MSAYYPDIKGKGRATDTSMYASSSKLPPMANTNSQIRLVVSPPSDNTAPESTSHAPPLPAKNTTRGHGVLKHKLNTSADSLSMRFVQEAPAPVPATPENQSTLFRAPSTTQTLGTPFTHSATLHGGSSPGHTSTNLHNLARPLPTPRDVRLRGPEDVQMKMFSKNFVDGVNITLAMEDYLKCKIAERERDKMLFEDPAAQGRVRRALRELMKSSKTVV